jgi:hypothetical protein
MTETETMEKLTQMRATLEQYRAGNPPVSSSLVTALEEEIKTLEATLPGAAPKKKRRVFLDECAG